MRTLLYLAAVLPLAGCATPAERAARAQRDAYYTRPVTTTCFGHRGFYHCTTF